MTPGQRHEARCAEALRVVAALRVLMRRGTVRLSLMEDGDTFVTVSAWADGARTSGTGSTVRIALERCSKEDR